VRGWRVGLRGFCCGEGRREVTQGVDANAAGMGEGCVGFGARRGGGGGFRAGG
jgi:hypothetical protein